MTGIALKQRIREIWQKPKHVDARPDPIATGFSIGIFASFLPLNPSPLIVATVVVWLLKRNVITAVAGAVASILYVPLLPFIWLAEYRLGKLILSVRHALALNQARLWDVLQKSWVFTPPCWLARSSSLPPLRCSLIWPSNGSLRDGLGKERNCNIPSDCCLGPCHCQQVRRQPCPYTARGATRGEWDTLRRTASVSVSRARAGFP